MKFAILGGSFNPVHLGHLFLADTVLTSLHYDRIIMIPAWRSPFKQAAKGMDRTAWDRLDMLAASIAADPRLAIDDCEIRREGISYTIDTLKDIIRRYLPTGKPGLIIGDDLAGEFPAWHQSEEILELADIIIARRIHSREIDCPYPNTQIANEAMEISSAMVRDRIESGAAWRYLVPAAARTIIEDRGLYGPESHSRRNIALVSETAAAAGSGKTDEGSRNSIIHIEIAARELLSCSRFLHSRNTALLAWDLCRRFGLDPWLGYLAGIGHDLGKELDDETLLELTRTDGGKISELERKKPSLLHGRAGAVLLRERFGIHNRDVLEAVALHTSGGEDMGPLAKIIYIADKLEVSREKIDPALRELCYSDSDQDRGDLDRIFQTVLKETVSWLRSRKMEVAEESCHLLKENI